MTLKFKTGNRVITIDVNRKTSDPVTEVLAMLNGNGVINKSYIFLDFSSLKSNRFGDGDLEKLFVDLPNQSNIKYIIALPERMIYNAEKLARQYYDSVKEFVDKPHYIVMNKKNSIMIVKQRNRV